MTHRMLGVLIASLLAHLVLDCGRAESALAAASIKLQSKARCEYRATAPSPPPSRLFGASNRIASRFPCAPSNGLWTGGFRVALAGCTPWHANPHKLERCMVEPFHSMREVATGHRVSNSSVACGAAPFSLPSDSAMSYTVFHVRTQATI